MKYLVDNTCVDNTLSLSTWTDDEKYLKELLLILMLISAYNKTLLVCSVFLNVI